MGRSATDTLNGMKEAIAGGGGGALFTKAGGITTATGLVNIDLEAGAKLLFPWGDKITPIRNETPRKTSSRGGKSHDWRQVTGINTTNLPIGVAEGTRGGVQTTSEQDMTSKYVGLGLEDFVTFEAEYAAEGFDDVLAMASENLLKATMISEEKMLFGGNANVSLGQPGTVTLSAPSTSAGALSNGTFYVGVVALSHDGASRATVANGVVQQIVRSNPDGSSDTINGGTSQPSAVQNLTLSGGGSTQNLGMTVAAIQGAVAYAWYVGSSASHQYLAAITTINSYVHNTAVPANTFQDFQTLAATDYSKTTSTYGFDGLLYSAPFSSTSGAYYLALATGTVGTGTQLTTDNSGGIKEINTLLKDRYDNYRLSPDTIWCNTQEMLSLKVLIVKNGGAPLIRMTGDLNRPAADIVAGATVGEYLNPYTGDLLKVRVHPFAVAGTMLFTTKEAPYAGSKVPGNLTQVMCRREYYSTLWPQRTRKREYGVYVDEAFLNYFPPAFAAITNIAPTQS